MNKGRVGEDRGSKEMDRCPLTASRIKRGMDGGSARIEYFSCLCSIIYPLACLLQGFILLSSHSRRGKLLHL
jgi:hypothetical protein